MPRQDQYEKVDLPFFKKEIAPLLPNNVIDFHVHIWKTDLWKENPWEEKEDGANYMVTSQEYPQEQLDKDTEMIFPGITYHSVIFGNPTPAAKIEETNDYIAKAGKAERCFPLMLAGKGLSNAEAIEERVRRDRFLGYKVFLNWFGDDYGSVRVEDMLSETEMKIADKYRLVVLLHVPRSDRLADPEISRGVRELAKSYPNAQIVLAHCGRCYLPDQMKKAAPVIADLPNVNLDSSMVMDPTALEILLEHVDSSRIVYASDFPVPVMRGRRVYVMDHWVDLVLMGYEESSYRVQSDNMRASFMVYEIILALRRAAERVKLSEEAFKAMFYKNAMRILEGVKLP